MTTFEIIILITLYLFEFGYTVNSYGLLDERNTRKDKILIVLAALTIGVFQFPMIFAADIWKKLNG